MSIQAFAIARQALRELATEDEVLYRRVAKAVENAYEKGYQDGLDAAEAKA